MTESTCASCTALTARLQQECDELKADKALWALVTTNDRVVDLQDTLQAAEQQVAALQQELDALVVRLREDVLPNRERDWRTLLSPMISGEFEASQPKRVAAFIRIHANLWRQKKHWDIPETIAAALENGAHEIEQLETTNEAAERQVIAQREYLQHKDGCAREGLIGNIDPHIKCTCGLAALLADPSVTE